MSEELEWELYDIFEAGLFAFPLYDHASARKIVRYLMFRGVPTEEIADSIEDDDVNLTIWLNKQGKNFVGEWVIAWVNEVRDEYDAEKAKEAKEEAEQAACSSSTREHSPYCESDCSHYSSAGGTPGGSSNMSSSSKLAKHRHRRQQQPDRHFIPPNDISSSDDDADDTKIKTRHSSPPPLPPRTNKTCFDVPYLRHIDSDCSDGDLSLKVSTDMAINPKVDICEHTPDSGAVSDLYSTIADECLQDIDDDTSSTSTVLHSSDNIYGPEESTTFPFDNITVIPPRVTIVESISRSCPTCSSGTVHVTTSGNYNYTDCPCTLSHYAYIDELTTSFAKPMNGSIPSKQPTTSDREDLHHYAKPFKSASRVARTCEQPSTSVSMTALQQPSTSGPPVSTSSPIIRAIDVHIETLERDGPGYIFIMTDSLDRCLPWSDEHCYKVASSRQPERFLTEFRSHNVSVELLWQVRVPDHIKAVREVHQNLQKYHMHSNWFKCPLSVIMESISHTVRKYRSA